MERPPIIISLSALAQWYQTLPTRVALEKLLQGYLSYLSGIELSLTAEEIIRWGSDIRNDPQALPSELSVLSPGLKKQLLSGVSVIIRVQDGCEFKAKYAEDSATGRITADDLAAAFNALYQVARVDHVITEIGTFSVHEYKAIFSTLDKGITLSVENDASPTNTLLDIVELLNKISRLEATFNLGNWFTAGRSSIAVELADFHKRVGRRITHISLFAPASKSIAYRKFPEVCRCVYADSGEEQISHWFLQHFRSTPWIIQGIIPPGHPGVLANEIFSLRALMSDRKAAV